MDIKIGIDPGLNGAISFVGDAVDKIFFVDMPVKNARWISPKKNKKGDLVYKKMVDAKRLFQIIKNCPYNIISTNIEVVHSMPKQGVSTTFTFGGSFYTAITVIDLLGYELNFIQPATWKRKFGLIGHSKDMSRQLLLSIYPGLQPKLNLKKHCDRADAFFIAIANENQTRLV